MFIIKKNAIYLLVVLLAIALQTGCFVMENRFTSIAPGVWRGVLQLYPREMAAVKQQEIHSARQLLTAKDADIVPKDFKIEEATEGELPFLFEIKYANDTALLMDIINGEERIPVASEDIRIGKDRSNGKDTFLISFPVFGSYIRGVYRERVMEGEFVIPAKNLTIPFKANYAQNHRFTTLNKKPTADLMGQWEGDFDISSEKPYKTVGEFTQNGNILRGTFRTETGDYRFLDGEVQADKFYLSCFDGSHAFLFEGKIQENGTLIGTFRSSKSAPEIWTAKRNPNFDLRNATSLTSLKEGISNIDFSFPNTEGKNISLKDFGNKVKIIQIMGTWCPNCKDETKFLTEYYQKNKNENLAVVALAFERNAQIAVNQLNTYKNKMNVPYEILLAGTTTNKDEAAKALPWLSKVVAYPTMLFVDKNNKVRKIHTGFDGPATSKYSSFVKEFEDFTKQLLSE